MAITPRHTTKISSQTFILFLKVLLFLSISFSAPMGNPGVNTQQIGLSPPTDPPLSGGPNWFRASRGFGALWGWCVSTAGDINADGFSDILVAGYDYHSDPVHGVVDIFMGSSEGIINRERSLFGDKEIARFGYSAAPAGDVNGDGYDDVIVGAPLDNRGLAKEGCAFLFMGSGLGLVEDPVWINSGGQGDANFGHSVKTAGDVNGDGYSDVLIGAPLYDGGESNEGRVFLYLGSSSGLATDPVWAGEINQANANFGSSVATAGDVNGDGYCDVIVGAFKYENGEPGEGAAFVFSGSRAGLSTEPSWKIEGNVAGAQFGFSVATAGDVNGDGYSDVVIGAPEYNEGSGLPDGRAFLFMGSMNGLGERPAWQADHDTGYLFGFSVATAGDINADGFSDVVVGAGRSYMGGIAKVYLGSCEGLSSMAVWAVQGEHHYYAYGASVCTAGDVNGDGHSDVIIGDCYDYPQGSAFVYHGIPPTISTQTTWSEKISGQQEYGQFASAIANAGDVNGDGYPDVIVGEYQYDADGENEGAAHVFLGNGVELDTLPCWTATGIQSGEMFGYSVSGAGDIDGDGYSDVFVGAPRYSHGQSDEGGAYLFSGSPNGPTTQPSWIGESNQSGAWYGASVAGVGDVNRDGYRDVVVGAFRYDDTAPEIGCAFLFLGSPWGLSRLPAWTAKGEEAYAWFGYSVAGAGDINRDGYSDVIIGAPTNGNAGESCAYLFHGTPDGLSENPVWTVRQNGLDRFGSHVAAAGDIFKDGYGDVLIAANSDKPGVTDEERIFLHNGYGADLSLDAVWSYTAHRPLGVFKGSVAAAGDVNGDGFGDIAIGDYLYSGGDAEVGRVLVFYGSDPDLLDSPSWTVAGGDPFSWFGYSIASAGDLNGDGVGDIVIGAPHSGQENRGSMFVYKSCGLSTHNLTPRQVRADGNAPVGQLGLSHGKDGFRLCVSASAPPAGCKMGLEYEVVDDKMPFDGTNIKRGGILDSKTSGDPGTNSVLSTLVTGLSEGVSYKWRLRVVTDSPYFPRGPWFFHPNKNYFQADILIGMPTLIPLDLPVNIGPRKYGQERIKLFSLQSIYPNPFKPETTICFSLNEPLHITLAIYNVQGKRVKILVHGEKEAGPHLESWDGRNEKGVDVGSGIYFVRLEGGKWKQTKKVVRIQ